MRSIIAAGVLLLATQGYTQAAEVYRWVDAQGVTHFSELPPGNQPATRLNTAVHNPSHPAAPTKQRGATEDPQGAYDEKVKKEVAEREVQIARYCDGLRTALAQLRNNPRLRIEEDGKTRRVSEEERLSRISKAEQQIEKDCR